MLLLVLPAFASARAANAAQYRVVTADPPLDRPATMPIVVGLFSNAQFRGYTPHKFRYAPPAAANAGSRHWGKIVLVADFACTAGRQFDRTCTISIGNANVFVGTTPEPGSNSSPTWRVERDLTDYAALLSTSHDAQVVLDNVVDKDYTGVLSGSARLMFYPSQPDSQAPVVPDMVLPLNSSGSSAPLRAAGDALSRRFTALPRDIERAYLDVIAQSQADDEFWYTNVPDRYAKALQLNGGGCFREGEVMVDGKPAGVVPVFPWIYTGGIDPSLWNPIPGVQALNLKPYRVDLTPFAGVFDDGRPHTVSVAVFGAQNHFATCATLLLYRDPSRCATRGGLSIDTMTSSPMPGTLDSTPARGKSDGIGPLAVDSIRTLVIDGYIVMKHGRVDTKIQEAVAFTNIQEYDNVSDNQQVRLKQVVTDRTTTTVRAGSRLTMRRNSERFGLDMNQSSSSPADKPVVTMTTAVRQSYGLGTVEMVSSGYRFASQETNIVHTSVSRQVNATSRRTVSSSSWSTQEYAYTDSKGKHVVKRLMSQGPRLVVAHPQAGFNKKPTIATP